MSILAFSHLAMYQIGIGAGHRDAMLKFSTPDPNHPGSFSFPANAAAREAWAKYRATRPAETQVAGN